MVCILSVLNELPYMQRKRAMQKRYAHLHVCATAVKNLYCKYFKDREKDYE